MICQNCFQENEKGSNFCIYCGSKLNNLSSTDQSTIIPLLSSTLKEIASDKIALFPTSPHKALQSPKYGNPKKNLGTTNYNLLKI